MGTQYEIRARLIDVDVDFFNEVFDITHGADSLKYEWFRKSKAKDCADVISCAVHSASETSNGEYLELLAKEIVRHLKEKDCDDMIARLKAALTGEDE